MLLAIALRFIVASIPFGDVSMMQTIAILNRGS